MADLTQKKFLDQSGVTTLWSRILTKLGDESEGLKGLIDAEVERATAAEEAALKAGQDAQSDVDALEELVGALPEGTTATSVIDYINKKTEGIATDSALAELQAQVTEHENSLAVLEGGEDVTGSVANVAKAAAVAEVAAVIAGADASFDTLKEIADWIANDTTGAAAMANDIAALELLVGNTAVATQIANAIEAALKVEGVDKYALASELTALAGRVKALEDAGYQNAEQVGSAIDAKISALDLANTYDAKGAAQTAENNAKAYADGLAGNYDAAGSAQTAENNAKAYADSLADNYDAAGAAATAEANAKAYTDDAKEALIGTAGDDWQSDTIIGAKYYTTKVKEDITAAMPVALSTEEIDAAIEAATPKVSE